MKLLTKFWMKTPVGKLVFNRERDLVWCMSSTTGRVDSVRIGIDHINLNSQEIIGRFGWPMFDNKFKPYGEIYEEPEVKRIEPAFVTEAPDSGEFHFLARHNKILWFKSAGDLLAYTIQEQLQEKSNG